MAKDVALDYKPTPKQEMFHRSTAFEVLYGGAAGGGKSRATVMEAMYRCLEAPGLNAYLFRRTYGELEDTLIAEARSNIPQALGRYRATNHDFEFINGSAIRFRHCAHEQDRYNYQGAEIHFLGIDELTQFPASVYDYLRTRVRVPNRIRDNHGNAVHPTIRCTANPGGVGHAWVKKYFIDVGAPYDVHRVKVYSTVLKKWGTRTRQYIPAFVTDNPHLSEDYVFDLEQKPTALRDALLHGKWDIFEGQVFTEFRDNERGWRNGIDTHVIEPFKIPAHWKRYRSFDYGYSRPFSVGWWAVDPDGIVYRYAEWYGCVNGEMDVGIKLSPVEIAKGIVARERLHSPGQRIIGVADPSIWDESRGASIADMMAKQGAHFQKGDNTRLASKARMHEYLRFDERGRPGLYVFRNCRAFIRTLPALVYDQHRPEDVETDCEDHVYDDARYFLMARPTKTKLASEPKRRAFNPLA